MQCRSPLLSSRRPSGSTLLGLPPAPPRLRLVASGLCSYRAISFSRCAAIARTASRHVRASKLAHARGRARLAALRAAHNRRSGLDLILRGALSSLPDACSAKRCLRSAEGAAALRFSAALCSFPPLTCSASLLPRRPCPPLLLLCSAVPSSQSWRYPASQPVGWLT